MKVFVIKFKIVAIRNLIYTPPVERSISRWTKTNLFAKRKTKTAKNSSLKRDFTELYSCPEIVFFKIFLGFHIVGYHKVSGDFYRKDLSHKFRATISDCTPEYRKKVSHAFVKDDERTVNYIFRSLENQRRFEVTSYGNLLSRTW